MKLYLGLLAAFVALTNTQCANGSCGREIVETVSANDDYNYNYNKKDKYRSDDSDGDGCGSKDDSRSENKQLRSAGKNQGKSVQGKKPFTK
jgi:hypothetical protein